MKVWDEDFAAISDHRLITCQLKLECPEEIVALKPERDERKQPPRWSRNDNGDRKFWANMEQTGNEVMDQWIKGRTGELAQLTNDKEAVTEALNSYQEHLNVALDQGLGAARSKAKPKSKPFQWDQKIYEAVWEEKVAYRTWKANDSVTTSQRLREKKKIRKKLVRNQERKQNQKEVAEIEKLRSKNPREYWRRLKRLNAIEDKKNIPSKIKNENDEWVVDGNGIQEIWAKAFEKLGMQDSKDEKFDEKFATQVREQVEKAVKHKQKMTEALDQPIRLVEVQSAIKKLKRGKAVGVDSYMNEIFMYGGEKIEQATWLLCREIFHREVFPKTWAQGLIFPIFKGGTNEERYDPNKYRGITLLSVLGKIYASVLNDRATAWIEEKGILVEEQAGFRKDRATVDQLFILTETIRNRRPLGTYVCFIDIQKAYDRVWRDGLWYKLHKYGLSGKLWRVLRSIYESVESCVLVNDRQSRWFDIEIGLRQGCLLSPILFAIYINGLAEEIQKEKLGVRLIRYKNDKLGTLMYADDIALIAKSKSELERVIDLTYRYSLRWRFSFNYEKCAVVVFKTHKAPRETFNYGDCTSECTCGLHWKFGEKLIKEVDSYKYLGVELDRNLSFHDFKKRVKEKARKNVSRVWYMGMYDGCLSVKASINLYQALVRSVLEYSCEIWGDEDWEEGERVQREMGRRILRCSGSTTNEAVLGELGWWRLRTRRDFCKLKYWIKILLLDDNRLVKNIYDTSKQKYLTEGTNNWCRSLHILAKKYNLLDLWNDETKVYTAQEDNRELRVRWSYILHDKVHRVEQEHWFNSVHRKPKLRTYVSFKSTLQLEPYLLSETHKAGRYLLTSIRTGTNKLRIETGRWKKPKEAPEDRVCRACMSGEIEDEKHFVLDCAAYASLRTQMIDLIRLKTNNNYNLYLNSRDEKWRILMNPLNRKADITEPLKEYLQRAMKKRAKI
jgi:hypothetical protein